MNPAKRKKMYRQALRNEVEQPVVVAEEKLEVKPESKKENIVEPLQVVKEEEAIQTEETKATETPTVPKKKKVVNDPV